MHAPKQGRRDAPFDAWMQHPLRCQTDNSLKTCQKERGTLLEISGYADATVVGRGATNGRDGP